MHLRLSRTYSPSQLNKDVIATDSVGSPETATTTTTTTTVMAAVKQPLLPVGNNSPKIGDALKNCSFGGVIDKLACMYQRDPGAEYLAVSSAFFLCYTRFTTASGLFAYLSKSTIGEDVGSSSSSASSSKHQQEAVVGYVRLIVQWIETRFEDDFMCPRDADRTLFGSESTVGAASIAPRKTLFSATGIRVVDLVDQILCKSCTSVASGAAAAATTTTPLPRKSASSSSFCQHLYEEVYRVKLALLRKYSQWKQSRSKGLREMQLSSIPGLARKTNVTFFDFPTHVVAEQLTLIDHSIFRAIRIEEFHNKNWTNERLAPALALLISRADQISYWVASCLLHQKTPVARAHAAARFVMIAHWCCELRNYNTMNSVIGGFDLWAIDRLKKQNLLYLESRYVKLLTEMNRIMSYNNNNAVYRRILADLYKSVSKDHPALPYIGVFTHDLTFAEDGNNDLIKDSDEEGKMKPNIAKISMLGETLNKIARFQMYDYSRRIKDHVPQLLRYLAECPRMTELELERHSLALKPTKQDSRMTAVVSSDELRANGLRTEDSSSSSFVSNFQDSQTPGPHGTGSGISMTSFDVNSDSFSADSADEMLPFSSSERATPRITETLRYIPVMRPSQVKDKRAYV